MLGMGIIVAQTWWRGMSVMLEIGEAGIVR